MVIDASASDNGMNSGEKPAILIVADSRVIRLALKKMLQKEYTLIEAGNGEEAWSLLMNNEAIQMVFSDLAMPELDGFGLLERIRNSELERMNTIPFIAMPDNEDDEKMLQRAHDCGATDLITKPFQSKDIKDRANTYTRTRHLIDSEIQSDIKTGRADVANLMPNEGIQHDEEDPVSRPIETYTQKIAVSQNHNVFKDVSSRVEHNAVLENKDEGTEHSKEGSEESYLACKREEHARQQEVMELIEYENELETVVAFDVHQRIPGNYRDDQGNKEETEIIRVEIEKKLAAEREQKLSSCSFFTRFVVSVLSRINTLHWINLDNKIKNILKHRAR